MGAIHQLPPCSLGIMPGPISASFVFVELVQTIGENARFWGRMMAIIARRHRVITNNPLIAAKWPRLVEWICGGAGDVLCSVRDHIHLGHRLLSHPLAGGIRPNESPYRSVFITDCPMSAAVDFDSLRIIEGSMAVMKGFGAARLRRMLPHADYDYQLIDCALMESAMESLHDADLGSVADRPGARVLQESQVEGALNDGG